MTVNPEDEAKPMIKHGNTVWRVGDRVMELKNQVRTLLDDDEKEEMVSNGDTGILEAIRPIKRSGLSDIGQNSGPKEELIISFNGERFSYLPEDLEHLDHAYAATIHKAQGSEYEVIILVLLRQHNRMLQRNLIYTALTRAKEKVYIVGQEIAVKQAIQSEYNSLRRTKLSQRLDLLS